MKDGDMVEVLSLEGVLPTHRELTRHMIGNVFMIESFTPSLFASFTITDSYHKMILVHIPEENLKVVI